MRISIVAGKAVSLVNVAKDIAYVAQSRGHAPRILTYIMHSGDLARLSDAVVLVYPASPLFCAEYMLLYRDLRVHYSMSPVYYTMIEGRPKRFHVRPWMLRDVEFVACSGYVRDRLVEAGFRVVDVVHHGLVRRVVEEAVKLAPTARRALKSMHGDKVVFGVVSHSHPRKGLDRLASAVRILSERRSDFAVHVVANPEASKVLGDVPNTVLDTVYGKRSREEILAFMAAVDFLVLPSLAEGFGLTLIEANAVGTVAIHSAYPPLTEVSDVENNLAFPYDDVRYVDVGDGIEYEYHLYSPKLLATVMEEAVEMLRERRSEYEDRCAKLRAALDRFDAERLYPRLLHRAGL